MRACRLTCTQNVAQNSGGSTPLAYLVTLPMSDHLIYVLHLMVKKGADVSIPNEHGVTPLHNACLRANEGMVILLVMNGANLDLPTLHKECPIHIAARLGKQRIVEALIMSGASYQTMIGPDGNAEETARRNGHDTLAEYIHNLRGIGSEKRKKKKRDKKDHKEDKQSHQDEKRKRNDSTAASTGSAPSAGLSLTSSSSPPKHGNPLHDNHPMSTPSHAESSEDENHSGSAKLVSSAPPSQELTAGSARHEHSKSASKTDLPDTEDQHPTSTSADHGHQTDPTILQPTPVDSTKRTQHANEENTASSPPHPRKHSSSTGRSSVSSNEGAPEASPEPTTPHTSSSGSMRHREPSQKFKSLMNIFQVPQGNSTSPEPALKRTPTTIATPTRSNSPSVSARTSTPAKYRNLPASGPTESAHSSKAQSTTSPRSASSAEATSSHAAHASTAGTSATTHGATATADSHTTTSAAGGSSTAPSSPVAESPLTIALSNSAPDTSLKRSQVTRDGQSAEVDEVPVNTSGRRSPNSLERSSSENDTRTVPVPVLNLNHAAASPSKANGHHPKSARDKQGAKIRPRDNSQPVAPHPRLGSLSTATTSDSVPDYSASLPVTTILNGEHSGESSEDSFVTMPLSARSHSTVDLTGSDGVSSDAKLPSGRRMNDDLISPPGSARSGSKPALDRSASDILTKMKPGQGAKQRSQGSINPLARMASNEFGPRSVQRVHKSNKARHSKPFTRALKDISIEKFIAVPQYPMPSYAVVNISESMIIHNPEFSVEVGKPLMSPSANPITLFSDDVEPLTWHYRSNFFDENMLLRSHWNFVAYLELSFHPVPVPLIISLAQLGGALHGVLRSTAGDLTFTLEVAADKKNTPLNAKKIIKLLQQQNEAFRTTKFFAVKEPSLADELLNFERTEKNQFRTVCSHKVGIVYVKEGQITEEEILGNKHGSDQFEAFLECIGERIDLQDWAGFDGGLDTKKDRTGKQSIFSTWREFEIMFHVSTYIPLGSAEEKYVERKKHIANDMTTIIFLDTQTTAFKPPTLSGDFLHNFIIVHPLPDGQVSVSVAARKGTPEFGPVIPPGGNFELGPQLKEFLLCKIINAERASQYAPMFLTKRRQARNTLLSMLINKYMPK